MNQKIDDFFLSLLKTPAKEEVLSKFIINLFNIGEYENCKRVFLILISYGDRSISLRTIQEMLNFLPHLKIKESDDYNHAAVLISDIVSHHDWIYRFLDNNYKVLIANLAFKNNNNNLINLINDAPLPVFSNRENFFNSLENININDLTNNLHQKYFFSLIENNRHLIANHHLGFSQGTKKIGNIENKIVDLLKITYPNFNLMARIINILQIDLLMLTQNQQLGLKENTIAIIKDINLFLLTGWLERIKSRKKKYKDNLLNIIFNNSLFNLKNAGTPLNNDMVNYFLAQVSLSSALELFKLEAWQYKLSEREHLYFRIRNMASVNWYDLPSHLNNKEDWQRLLDSENIEKELKTSNSNITKI